MDQQYKIKIYFKTKDEKEFDERDCLSGEFILYEYEENWFEGVVSAPCAGSFQGDRFIYGVLIPEAGMRIVELSKKRPGNAYIFNTQFSSNYYVGDCKGDTILNGQEMQCIVKIVENPLSINTYLALGERIANCKKTLVHQDLMSYNNPFYNQIRVGVTTENPFPNNYELDKGEENYKYDPPVRKLTIKAKASTK